MLCQIIQSFIMAFSKHHLYNPTDQLTGSYANAFSHAARILIIKQLLINGPSAVQVIAKDHPIHKESLSGHFKTLRSMQLVHWNEKYPYTFYSIHDENLKTACRYITDLIKSLQIED